MCRRLRLPRWIARPRHYWRSRIEASSDLNKQADVVADLIAEEPWFTYFTDHDDGIERTDLQLALCELARFTRPVGGRRHYENDNCEEYADDEEELDARAAAASASASPNPECRASGHSFATPWLFRDTCSRCGCVRLMRGNPSRFVYEYPDDPSVSAGG